MRIRLAALLLLTTFSAATHADAIRFIAELPFTSCDGLICLPVTLEDGQQKTFVLDTGDVTSYLAQDTAQTLGWQLETYVGRDGKPVEGLWKSGPHALQLGPIALDSKLLVFPRKDLGPGVPYDGGIVFTAFKDRVLQIDYPHHLLRISEVLSDSGKSSLPGTLKTITFGKHGPAILTGGPFTVNGRTVQAQIDTCYTGSLLIYDAAVPRLGLRAIADKGAARVFPHTDGGVTMLAMPAQSLGFSGRKFTFEHPTIYFATPGVHQPDGLFEATVGNELFAGSVLTLDLHHMTFDVSV